MEFASKGYFLLLLLLIPYILWYFLYRKKNAPTMRMSDTKKYQYAPKSLRVRLIHLPMVLRCICFVLIVCAMARPQTHTAWDNKTVEGIDIMLAMDVSTSMLAEDLRPNRMEAAKDVAIPETEKKIWLSAFGQRLPSLSTTFTSTKVVGSEEP